MKKNVGTIDRIVRFVIVIAIAILLFTGKGSGTLAIILGIVGFISLFTGLFRFCALYSLVGLNTDKKEK
ncbi:MAG: DUF2892 domain-containing protein [Bacteroidota bacterium]